MKNTDAHSDDQKELPSGEYECCTGTQVSIFVAFRPYLREFLRLAAQTFEVVLYTASEVSKLPA